MATQNNYLTGEQIKQLSDFLLDRADFSLMQLFGFCAAIISGPSLVQPSLWMPAILKKSTFKSQAEAQEITRAIFIAYNDISDELREPDYKPFAFRMMQGPGVTAKEETARFLSWVDGFMIGMELMGEEWLDSNHTVANALMYTITSVAKDLHNNDARRITQEELALVKSNIKLFQGYWIEHRECEGKPRCVINKIDTLHPDVH